MAEEDKPKRQILPFLRLDEIEDEGERAVQQRARELFARSMKMGGQIDWSALRTGGPAVHQAFLALMSSQAAAEPAFDPGMGKVAGRADPANAGKAKTNTSTKPDVPRIGRNWRDRRTSAFDFRWHAFWTGAVATTAVCLIAFSAIRWFEL